LDIFNYITMEKEGKIQVKMYFEGHV